MQITCNKMISVILLLAVLAGHVSTQTRNDCPSGIPRDEYLQVYKDTCFQFELNRKREYANAQVDCQSNGGTLAIISSQEIQDFLYGELVHYYGYKYGSDIWIGLNDKAHENIYEWEDGTTMSYSNWDSSEGPTNWNHNSEDCVALSPLTGKWKDHPCRSNTLILGIVNLHNHEYPYICQYKITTAATTPAPKPTYMTVAVTAIINVPTVTLGPFVTYGPSD